MRRRKVGVLNKTNIKVLNARPGKTCDDRVHLFLKILTAEIEPKYSSRPKIYLKYKIHTKPGTKYYKLITGVLDYLHSCRGAYANPTEYLIRDYLDCIYSKYQGYGRLPSLSQLGAYDSNQITFDDWVASWEEEMGEGYWVSACNIGEIKRRAKEAIEGTSQLLGKPYSPISDVDIIEV